MANARETGSAAHRMLTFDCPWCGAISRVQASQIGDHFPCPECRRVTRLTEANATDQPPTLPPPDAPHLSGDRTFDCPWCGAIAAVPSSHLGERFDCPECRKDTKLTATNTRRLPVTAPPPDAPHPESGVGRRAVLVAVGVAVVALLAWLIFGGGEESKESPKKIRLPGVSVVDRPPPAMPTPTPAPEPGMETGMDGRPGAAPGMAGPPMPTPTPPTPDPLEVARAEWLAATTALAEKTAALAKAEGAIEGWRMANPEAAAAAEDFPALKEVTAEARRLLSSKDVLPDPAKPTPAQVRAYNAAVAKFAGDKPERVKAMERLLAAMRLDPSTSSEVADREWKDLNFFGSGSKRALAKAEAEWGRAASPPDALVTARVSAAEDVAAAKKAADDADAKVKALEAAGGK